MRADTERHEVLLQEFIERARRALGEAFRSAILFGSAAEARLRSVSDVNLLLVLRSFEAAQIDALREPLRTMRSAIDLRVMFVLEAELPHVIEAFAVKFADIAHRHRVLAGEDLTASLRPTRGALAVRARQEFFNLALRMRERYASASLRPEQTVRALAEFAGGLRACAAALSELRAAPSGDNRSALLQLARSLGPEFEAPVANLSKAREGAELSDHEAGASLLALAELARRAALSIDDLPV